MKLKNIDMGEFEEDIAKTLMSVCTGEIDTVPYYGEKRFLNKEYGKITGFVNKDMSIFDSIRLEEDNFFKFSMSESIKSYETYIDKHLEGIKDPELYLVRLGLDAYYRWDFDFEENSVDEFHDANYKRIISKYFSQGCPYEMLNVLKCTYIDYGFRCIEYLKGKMKDEL